MSFYPNFNSISHSFDKIINQLTNLGEFVCRKTAIVATSAFSSIANSYTTSYEYWFSRTPVVEINSTDQKAQLVQQDLSSDLLQSIKEKKLDWLSKVSSNGLELVNVPEWERTEEICLAAVSQNGQALRYVPEEKRTLPLCILAVKHRNSPCDLTWIPNKREMLLSLYEHDPAKVGQVITTHLNKERKEILTAAMDRFLTKDLLGHVVNDGKKAYIDAAIDHRDPSIGDFLFKEFLAHSKLDLEETVKQVKNQEKVLLPLFIALTYGIEPKQVLSKIKFVKHESTIKLFLSFMKEMDDKQYSKQEKADLFLHVFDEQLEFPIERITKKTHRIEHRHDSIELIPIENAKRSIEKNESILNLRLAMFKMMTSENRWQLFLKSKDFSTETIKDFLVGDLLQNGFIDSSIKDAKGLFLDKFLNFRIPGAIFTYAAHFIEDKEMIEPIKQFISVVMKDTFLDDRHAFNSHKSFLSQEQLAVWEKSTSNPLEIPIQKEQPFDRSKDGFKHLCIYDTEDPQDLLLCGTEVFGSCLNIAGDLDYNKCLMGYVLDGKVRLLAIKNSEGKIEARAVLKLLVDEKNQPVLFLENLYPHKQFESQIRQLAKQKAYLMNVPLFVKGEGETLYSKGCKAPYEYEDGADSEDIVNKGIYQIKGIKII